MSYLKNRYKIFSLSINLIKFYVYFWFSIVLTHPIIDNEKILYPFHKLLIVFACIDQVMLTVTVGHGVK
jgi:hypothetical protein